MPTVIITGANRGLGLEFARQYTADGWRVIATVRNPDQATELRTVPGVTIHRLDVGDPGDITAFAAGLGDGAVDLLINNAGIMGPPPARQNRDVLDTDGWQETLRINGLAPVLVTLALAGHLARAARPVVATVSSQLGSIASNTTSGYYAYRMSKAAVNMGMRNLALDLADRQIAVVILHPGWVQTDMGGPQAPLTPSESVGGMRQVISGIDMSRTGQFLDYSGAPVAW